MGSYSTKKPDWDQLFEIAAQQDGLFTTKQAAQSGYSPQLLAHHQHAGRMVRARRGVYRLVHFPGAEHEDLTTIWLWSEKMGVFSHETALALHELSDALPAKVHMTLPASWKSRRLRVPRIILLYFADLSTQDCVWAGAVQITSAPQTVIDCARAGVSLEIIEQAIEQGLHRGLFTEVMIKPA
ncbi:type IV toxin-antitoxin system AbiEi family antitoxin domain-containing protein, partial [Myxococcota bacterium]|nr:type IV toxin-antitoxin system AbiEi family antitoxin domain-containing protein [Myxococcota bacterium]